MLHIPDFSYTATPLAAWALNFALVLPGVCISEIGGVAPLSACKCTCCNTHCNTYCNTHILENLDFSRDEISYKTSGKCCRKEYCKTYCVIFDMLKYRFHHLLCFGSLNKRGLIPGVCSTLTSYFLFRSCSYNRQFFWAYLHIPILNF